MAEIVNMPKLGFDMAEGTLVRWIKKSDEAISIGEILAEIETDKATVEIEANAEGFVRKLLVAEGDVVPIGAPIAIIGQQGESIDALVSEITKEKAMLEDIRPAEVTPTLEEHDTESALESGAPSQADGQAAFVPTGKRPPPERIPLSKLHQTIGRRMGTSNQEIPAFYVTADVDAGPLMSLRSQQNESRSDGEKFSLNDFIVKAAAMALRRYPNLNASLDGDSIVRHGQINIGIAVAAERGLMTIVIRDVDLKPLSIISQEARQAIARARSNRVRPEDVEGSTFTVSNLGMFDVDHFIAIINPPEAAILTIGSVRQEPVVHDGQVVIGRRMKATISADHRVTDGADAAQWLQAFRALLEEPLQLLL